MGSPPPSVVVPKRIARKVTSTPPSRTSIARSRSSRKDRQSSCRGLAYLEKRDTERAVRDFSQAISLDPHNVGAILNRAQARRAAGDLKGWFRTMTS